MSGVAAVKSNKMVFMFQYEVRNYRKSLTPNGRWSSYPIVARNLDWKLWVGKRNNNLAIHLGCYGKTNLYSCYARVKLTLLSSDDSQNISKECHHLFSVDSNSTGFDDFLNISSLNYRNSGFVVDNTIKIQAYVEADTPQNVSINCDIVEPKTPPEWLRLFEKEMNDKIVRRISDEFKVINRKIEDINSLAKLNSLLEKTEKFHSDYLTSIAELRLIKTLENRSQGELSSRNKNVDVQETAEEKGTEEGRGEENEEDGSDENDEECSEVNSDEDDTESSITENNEAEVCETEERLDEHEEELENGSIIDDDITLLSEQPIEVIDVEERYANIKCEEIEEDLKPVVKKEDTKPPLDEESARSAINFFKSLIVECQPKSPNCCQSKVNYGNRSCCGSSEFNPYNFPQPNLPSPHLASLFRPGFYETNPYFNAFCNMPVMPAWLKRKAENEDSGCSSAYESPQSSDKRFRKDEVSGTSSSDSRSSSSIVPENSKSVLPDLRKVLKDKPDLRKVLNDKPDLRKVLNKKNSGSAV